MSQVEDTDEGVRWVMNRGQHALLVSLLEQLDAALDGPTDDPIVKRLFPKVVEDDPDQDAELRLLLAGDLLLRRHEAIRLTLERFAAARRAGLHAVAVELVEDEPAMVLSVLNDIRLALGARIGPLAVELRQLIDPDDEEAQRAVSTMDLLAWFQMQLLEVIDPSSARHDSIEDPDLDD